MLCKNPVKKNKQTKKNLYNFPYLLECIFLQHIWSPWFQSAVFDGAQLILHLKNESRVQQRDGVSDPHFKKTQLLLDRQAHL